MEGRGTDGRPAKILERPDRFAGLLIDGEVFHMAPVLPDEDFALRHTRVCGNAPSRFKPPKPFAAVYIVGIQEAIRTADVNDAVKDLPPATWSAPPILAWVLSCPLAPDR